MGNEIFEFAGVVFKFLIIPVLLMTLLINLLISKFETKNRNYLIYFFIVIIYPIIFYMTPFLEKLPYLVDYLTGMEETTQDYGIPTLKHKTLSFIACAITAIIIQGIINLIKKRLIPQGEGGRL